MKTGNLVIKSTFITEFGGYSMKPIVRFLLPFLFGISLSILALLAARGQTATATSDSLQVAIRYVATTGSDTTDCTNSVSPCATIQYAVDQASPGDEIRVAAGEYSDMHTRPRMDVKSSGFVNQIVYVNQTINIRGGYTLTNWVISNPNDNLTTLDAKGQGRVIYITGLISPTVEGLIIVGGDAGGLGGYSPNADLDAGGGIYIITSTAVISNNEISSNAASIGGGILIRENDSWIYSNIISNNTADQSGGGHFVHSNAIVEGNMVSGHMAVAFGGGLGAEFSKLTIVNNHITNNEALSGGGIRISYYSDGTSIIGNTISHNSGNTEGGGIYISMSDEITIKNNTITSNTLSNEDYGHGGGIYIQANPFTITQNTISYNDNSFNSSGYGGGIYINIGNGLINGNLIAHNKATLDGGGIFFQSDSGGVISENIFFSNIAEDGGGMYLGLGDVLNNIFDSNSAVFGGGIYTWGTNSIENNKFINNAAISGGGAYVTGHSTFINNVVADNQAESKGAGIQVFEATAHFIHNTLARNEGGDGGLSIGGGFPESSAFLTDTIIVSHTVGVIVYPGFSQDFASFEATLWGNDTDWAEGGTITTGTINLYGNPGFVDPANGDYHLNSTSIAIDAGIDAGVTTDLDGEVRPYAAGFDLGADEWLAIPDLQVTKTAHADEILAGDALTYTLRLTNTGTLPLHAWITDTLPVSVTPTGVLTWTTLILPGQGWTQTVVVTSSAVYSGTLTNTLTVTTEEGASGTATALVTALAPTPPEYRQYLPLVIR
jgi:uncharacterized repeat protein (TIGR01451 family)